MAVNKTDNYKLNAPKNLNDWSGVFDGTPIKWRPYNNVAEFLARKPSLLRFETEEFYVRSTTDAKKVDVYLLDSDLVPYKQETGGGGGGSYTDSQIKTKYENNPDTNALTDARKNKLDAIDMSTKVDKVAGERLINASEITKLSNQSGTNTGDNATNSQYSGLAGSKLDASQKATANGVASLDATGKIPTSQLPAT